jgi:hypothetical protein
LFYHSKLSIKMKKNFYIQDDDDDEFRNISIYEYATSIYKDHKKLWNVSLDYLKYTEKGIFYIENIIDGVEFNNEIKTQKIVQYLNSLKNYYDEKHHLFIEQIKISVYKKNAKYYLINENYVLLIRYSLLSEDFDMISKLTYGLFEDYIIDKSKINNLKLISDSISTFKSNELSFLKEYFVLIELIEMKKYVESSELILKLLQGYHKEDDDNNFFISPKRFWIIILLHSIVVLEQNEIIFNKYQTYLLMNFLQELVTSHKKDEYLKGIDPENIDLLHFSLVRNLSKSILLKN